MGRERNIEWKEWEILNGKRGKYWMGRERNIEWEEWEILNGKRGKY